MKITKPIEDILNKQIAYEFEAAYAYLSLAAALGSTPYAGFAHWMRLQYEEELEHAMKLFDYIQERQGCVKLLKFEYPTYTIKTPLEAFKIAYDLEIENTQHIHDAYALSLKENDLPSQVFLQWYITEQVEEEDNCQKMIEALELAGTSLGALFTLDRQAGSRK